MFHWCQQETEALYMVLGSLPLIGIAFRMWHMKWHAKFKTICGHKPITNTSVKNVCCDAPSHTMHPATKEDTDKKRSHITYLTKEDIDKRREGISKYEWINKEDNV